MKSNHKSAEINSAFLNRDVKLDILQPHDLHSGASVPLLIMNDGQDFESIHLRHIAQYLWQFGAVKPFIVVAVHAENRMQEYGVAGRPDFKKRGDLADAYSSFVVEELLPWVKSEHNQFHISEIAICGFSLGGLSAFDIAWRHSHNFSKVGAFSPSFWWRSKDLKLGYTDADRIIHQVVLGTDHKPNLNIWFQCGTLDETADRNNNGIIDSIDDCLDLIAILKSKGFQPGHDLHYSETLAGRHTLETYSIMLPYFLRWAFGH